MNPEITHDVFLSYSSPDIALVESLASRLVHEAGLRVWLDRARLQPGLSWRSGIEAAMSASSATLIIWGVGGLGRVQREERDLAYALRDARPDFRVLYAFLPAAVPPEGSWANVDTWIRFARGLDEPEAFARLVSALKGEAPPAGLLADLPPHPAPYRGLAAFELQDSEMFFGRRADVDEMLERLRHYPFLAVLGPSGSGKTSLVQAGLLAAMRQDSAPGVEPVALVVRPGPHPLRSLAAALTRLSLQPDPLQATDLLVARLAAKEDALADVLQIYAPSRASVLLVVDRLEEVFTLCERSDEQERFLQLLLDLIRQPDQATRVVATLRADFYGHLAPHAEFAGEVVRHQIYLKAMTEEGVSEVIEAPAAQVGAIFEKGLAARIRLDARKGDEVVLPLLQHALDLVWRKRRGRWLTWDAYEETGGVSGALRFHADRVVEELSPTDREIARRMLLRMIWLTEDAHGLAARRVAKAGLLDSFAEPARAERILQRLADERLIVLRADDGEPTAELVHDTLPVHWERLRTWVQADREFLLWRQRLRGEIADWERTGRDEGTLLRGALLVEAERWLTERSGELQSGEEEFVRRSVTLRDGEQAAKERARRRAIAGTVAVAVALSVAAAFAGWQWSSATQQRRRAEREREIAVGRQAASQAELVLNQQVNLFERAALLAVEAVQRIEAAGAWSLEADQGLRRSLALLPRSARTTAQAGYVQALAFVPNAAYFAIARDNREIVVWDAMNGREITRIPQQRLVHAAAFSADGRYLATSSNRAGDTITIREVLGGHTVARLPVASGVHSLRFSPDGKHIAGTTHESAVRVWEVSSGRLVGRLAHNSSANPGFSPDGRYVATTPTYRTAQVWEAATGRPLGRINHRAMIWSVSFSPDGSRLATASMDTARVWDAKTGKPIVAMVHPDWVQQARFSPGGTHLFTVSGDRMARVWDATNGREIARLPHDATIRDIAWSADGATLATAGQDNTVRVWEATTGRERSRMSVTGLATVLGVSADGRFVAAAAPDTSGARGVSRQQRIWLWELADHNQVALMRHTGEVGAVLFSPDGKRLATASEDGTARIWDALDGSEIVRVTHGHWVNAIAFSPDGKLLATASEDGTVFIQDAATGRETARMRHRGSVVAVAFSRDGHRVATAGADRTARVWDAATGREMVTVREESPVDAVAFSPDGSRLATSSADNQLRLWESATGQPAPAVILHSSVGIAGSSEPAYRARAQLVAFDSAGKHVAGALSTTHQLRVIRTSDMYELTDLPQGSVRGVLFSPDGLTLAIAGVDGGARIWDLAAGTELAALAHEGPVSGLAFSADGKHLASASEDGTARIWDLASGQEIARVRHDAPVHSVAFDGEGKYFATASADGTARSWLWRPRDLIAEACASLTRNLTESEWRRYFVGEPYRLTCPNLIDNPRRTSAITQRD